MMNAAAASQQQPPRPEGGTVETFKYDNRIVRAFAIATVIWGIVGMTAGLLAAVELFFPAANLNFQFITFGRLRPVHTNAVIFAFVGNGMFTGIYYSLQRLCKARMFSDKLSWLNFWGWNAIIVAAAVTLPLGLTTSKEYAELEWPIKIAIALIWVAFTVNLLGTIVKRREKHIYVAIWFYIATALTVAILHIVNGLEVPVSLWKGYSIYAGVQDALVQWWYGHNAVAFFLTTPYLGLMYYYLPKAANRPIFSYRLSIIHFWALIFIYIWAGPHHLLYTALPDWAQSLGMVFSIMLIAPSWGGMLNGLLTLRGAWDKVRQDPVLKFMVAAVTAYGMATLEGPALAIKTVDPTAEVSGPVIDNWWAYFYSMADIRDGWDAGPCYEPWSDPVDRKAHGGMPFIEYYLQQFAAAENTYGRRLLDYVDLHTYFAADNTGLTTAGNTSAQQARLNSTRVFWDSTYTDPTNNYPQPNYITDSNYTTSCSPPQQAPQLIHMMKTWVANDYPGTKLAIDEYNFGGLEAINGAVTQADILGIFGREGLDLGALWPTQAYNTQGPGNMAFAVYRNYDGNNSTFGNTVLPSTSGAANANQGSLSVYAALRTSDSAVTVVVINKTYGPLTSIISLTGLPSNITTAQAYLYSNANLAAIIAQPAVTVTPPAPEGTSSTIAGYTFPAQSITLFVVPTL